MKKGMTLVEVVVAMTIIAVVSLVFLVSALTAANIFKKASELSAVLGELSSQLEEKISASQDGESLNVIISDESGQTREIAVIKITAERKTDSGSEIKLDYYYPAAKTEDLGL